MRHVAEARLRTSQKPDGAGALRFGYDASRNCATGGELRTVVSFHAIRCNDADYHRREPRQHSPVTEAEAGDETLGAEVEERDVGGDAGSDHSAKVFVPPVARIGEIGRAHV